MPLDEFLKKINKWSSKGLDTQIKSKFYSIEFYDSREDFEKIIRCWVHLINNNILTDEMLFILLLSNENQDSIIDIHFNGDKEEYKSFVSSLFLPEGEYTFKHSTIISSLLRSYLDKDNFVFILTKSELQDIAVDYLTKYLQKMHTFNITCLLLYQNCWEKLEADRGIIIDNRANSLINNHLQKYPNDYLKYVIRPEFMPHDDGNYVFEPYIPQYFGSFPKFEEFLTGQQESNDYASQLLVYFNVYKSKDYKQFHSDSIPKYLRKDNRGNVVFREA